MTDNIDDNWLGVMIEVADPFIGEYRVPGWECKTCGWTIGSQGAPPSHDCPREGIQQKCDHEWSEVELPTRYDDIVYRVCLKCDKEKYRVTKQSGRLTE